MNQFKLILIALLSLGSSYGIVNGKIINCYYATWSIYRTGAGKFQPSDINPHLCTHLSYAFFGISNSGKMKVLNPWLDLDIGWGHISKTMDLKKINPKLKVMAVIGGWIEGSKKYSEMAADPYKRRLFIESTVEFLLIHNFDGLDLYWDYSLQPDSEIAKDKENFVILLKEMHQMLKPLKLLFSVAVGASAPKGRTAYDIRGIASNVDFINVMAYDFVTFSGDDVGFNAPLKGQGENNVISAIEFWLQEGASASKLVMGLAAYGRTITLAESKNYSLGAPILGPGEPGPFSRDSGFIGFNEICTLNDTWLYQWASVNSVPFLHKSYQFISYDDVRSIQLKVDYANFLNLSGVMIWSIDTDDFLGDCGLKYPLLNAVNNQMG